MLIYRFMPVFLAVLGDGDLVCLDILPIWVGAAELGPRMDGDDGAEAGDADPRA